MVVMDKIQEAKECFAVIDKKGYNGYQKFKYIELKELNPIVREVCKQHKLRTNFEWNIEEHFISLTVADREDGSDYTARIPIAPVTAGDAGKYMQDIGRIQTYAMRYLYFQVFEIAVPDEIDSADQRKTQDNKSATAQQISVPSDASEELKQLVDKIKKDFGKKVPFTQNTLKNKLGSMKKSQQISEELYIEAMKLTQ